MPFRHKRFVSSSLLGISLALIACNVDTFAGGALLAKKSKSKSSEFAHISVAGTANGETAVSWESLAEASFEALRTVSMSDYISAVKERMSNDPIEVEGQTFFDLKNFATRHEDLYQKISEQYAGIGEFFDAIGITHETDILPESVASGYARLAESYRSGELEDFLSNVASSDLEVSHNGEAGDPKPNGNDNMPSHTAAIALLIPSSQQARLLLLDDTSAPTVAGAAASSASGAKEEVSCDKGYHKCNAWAAGSVCCLDPGDADPGAVVEKTPPEHQGDLFPDGPLPD